MKSMKLQIVIVVALIISGVLLLAVGSVALAGGSFIAESFVRVGIALIVVPPVLLVITRVARRK